MVKNIPNALVRIGGSRGAINTTRGVVSPTGYSSQATSILHHCLSHAFKQTGGVHHNNKSRKRV